MHYLHATLVYTKPIPPDKNFRVIEVSVACQCDQVWQAITTRMTNSPVTINSLPKTDSTKQKPSSIQMRNCYQKLFSEILRRWNRNRKNTLKTSYHINHLVKSPVRDLYFYWKSKFNTRIWRRKAVGHYSNKTHLRNSEHRSKNGNPLQFLDCKEGVFLYT